VTVSSSDIATLAVVIPARDEEALLPRCLASVTASIGRLRATVIVPRVRIIVVVDDSSDGTLRIARRCRGVEVLASEAGMVGAARHTGVDHLLRTELFAGVRPGGVWIACTDADSAVPPDWLCTQLGLARSGADLVLGTVRPDPAELEAGLLSAWRLRHQVNDGHPHVHGANLGIRGDTYWAAGGFRSIAVHEDVLLASAVRQIGGRVVSTGSSPVLTSSRMSGRAPDGMAGYLGVLAEEADLPREA
jgi:glycosyltransferase involved in cell wall biosynthesis